MRERGINNDGKSWNSQSYLYQRLIQPGEPVSLERSDFEEQQENSGKQDEEEDGIFECDSPCDDGDIPSLEREADFYLRRLRFPLRRKYSLQQLNVLGQFVFISLVMKLWDCRHVLCLMHFLTLFIRSLIPTCL